MPLDPRPQALEAPPVQTRDLCVEPQLHGCVQVIAGLFVAGDMSQGASLVVSAMADGLAVARGVLRVMGC